MAKPKKTEGTNGSGGGKDAKKEKETKRAKFQRLAEKRMNKALESLRILGQLSNRAVYDYTEEDVDAMFGALNGVIADVNEKYKAGLAKGASAEQEKLFSFGKADVGKTL